MKKYITDKISFDTYKVKLWENFSIDVYKSPLTEIFEIKKYLEVDLHNENFFDSLDTLELNRELDGYLLSQNQLNEMYYSLYLNQKRTLLSMGDFVVPFEYEINTRRCYIKIDKIVQNINGNLIIYKELDNKYIEIKLPEISKNEEKIFSVNLLYYLKLNRKIDQYFFQGKLDSSTNKILDKLNYYKNILNYRIEEGGFLPEQEENIKEMIELQDNMEILLFNLGITENEIQNVYKNIILQDIIIIQEKITYGIVPNKQIQYYQKINKLIKNIHEKGIITIDRLKNEFELLISSIKINNTLTYYEQTQYEKLIKLLTDDFDYIYSKQDEMFSQTLFNTYKVYSYLNSRLNQDGSFIDDIDNILNYYQWQRISILQNNIYEIHPDQIFNLQKIPITSNINDMDTGEFIPKLQLMKEIFIEEDDINTSYKHYSGNKINTTPIFSPVKGKPYLFYNLVIDETIIGKKQYILELLKFKISRDVNDNYSVEILNLIY